MKVRDLGSNSLLVSCPKCGHLVQLIDRYLERRYPPDMLLVTLVSRLCCGRCSRPGAPTRPVALIEPYPRSGAEHS